MGQKVRPTGFRVGIMTDMAQRVVRGQVKTFRNCWSKTTRSIRAFIPKYLGRKKDRSDRKESAADDLGHQASSGPASG